MKILIDAMGGDHAPESMVKGSLDAIKNSDSFKIILIGDSMQIEGILSKYDYDKERIEVIHTTETIECDDIPTISIKTKKESSMVTGFNLLKDKKGDAFISAGNSGALMVGAHLILGRIKGVDRPALAAIIPSDRGGCLMLDVGLNTMAKPLNFYQFALMGSIYYRELFDKDNPEIGLINVGTEEGKGSETIKEAFDMLKKSDLNFIGNIESKDIFFNRCDIAICDGFTGNVLLKSIEGVAKYIFGKMKFIYNKSFANKISALVIKKDLKLFKSTLDADENGGAPLLGVNGLVIKSHGNSNDVTIKNVILKTAMLAGKGFQEKIVKVFSEQRIEALDNE